MNVALYKLGCPRNYVLKTGYINTAHMVYQSSSYHMLEGGNVTDLTILINDTSPSLLNQENLPDYAFITEFLRYYFVTTIDVVKEGLLQVTLHCDVLTSFRSKLLSKSNNTQLFYVDRCSNPTYYNVMYDDPEMIRSNGCSYTDTPSQLSSSIESDSSTECFVLVCARNSIS